jgi:hypothetical protein
VVVIAGRVRLRLTDASWHGRLLPKMAYFPQFRT